MSKSNLLIDETPLVFQPSLARAIGLSEAIVLQTMHYLCSNKRCGRIVDDKRWIYNSYKGWQEEFFPFWSERTIADVFRALEKMGLIRSQQLDIKQGKAMKYYTVSNVAKTLLTSERFTHLEDSSTWGAMLQDLPDAMLQDLPDHQAKNGRSARASNIYNITKTLTKDAEKTETPKVIDENKINPTEKPQGKKSNDSEFETFYSSYPKKVAKPNARKAWDKNKCKLEEVLPALERHKKTWNDPQFIPHPATWLNQRRWEDDVIVKQESSTPKGCRMTPAEAVKHNGWTDEFWKWLHETMERTDIQRDYLTTVEDRWLVEFIAFKKTNGYF
jgi:hypothetical protein